MKQKPVWVIVALLVGVYFISMPQAAFAQTAKNWRTMHAGAHAPTVGAAEVQCALSRVSVAECAEFAGMLKAQQCSTVSVPDKTMYRFMNGARGTQGLTRKMLGGNTPALRCHLSTGRVLDWYHESVTGSRACNNVGEPILVTQTPRLKVTSSPLMSSPKVLIIETPGIHVHTSECCHECGDSVYLPGNRAILLQNR
jgi:hypothetical protein